MAIVRYLCLTLGIALCFMKSSFMEMNTLGRYSSISTKGDNFCDFLFIFLFCTPSPFEFGAMSTHKKDIICLLGANSSFVYKSQLIKEAKYFSQVASPASVFIPEELLTVPVFIFSRNIFTEWEEQLGVRVVLVMPF